MNADSLGGRMKEYEAVSKQTLLRRTPVIIRVDGKAFHTFTNRIGIDDDASLRESPFSRKMHQAMANTMLALCEDIQNVRFGYTQSDEISLLLTDWDNQQTQQWFGGKVQKIVSIAAAMTTAYFNTYFREHFVITDAAGIIPTRKHTPLFDARVFNLPKEEVANYFIWRQQDATRNSVNMLGRFYFSHKMLHGKSNKEVMDMLMALDPPVNWNDLDTWQKRGMCDFKNIDGQFVIANEPPIFTVEREYIEWHLEK